MRLGLIFQGSVYSIELPWKSLGLNVLHFNVELALRISVNRYILTVTLFVN
jgi:hypothetical protein